MLATPRTLSALGWCFFTTDQGISDEIMRADHRAVQDVAVEFSVTIGSEVPALVVHQFDSAGQPWLHTHVIVGALARPERPGWTGPQREREVWAPLDPVTVVGMAERLVFGYHLLVRRAVSPTLRELGLNWQQSQGTPPDQDVYFGVELSVTGIQAMRSSLAGSLPVEVPDLRCPDVRRAHAADD